MKFRGSREVFEEHKKNDRIRKKEHLGSFWIEESLRSIYSGKIREKTEEGKHLEHDLWKHVPLIWGWKCSMFYANMFPWIGDENTPCFMKTCSPELGMKMLHVLWCCWACMVSGDFLTFNACMHHLHHMTLCFNRYF